MQTMLTSRERVLLALEHRTTDRIPFAMICSGINPPAHRALNAYLRDTRGVDLDTWLEALTDVVYVLPEYIGPARTAGEDIWGVRREAMSYGEGSYDEIAYYPLAGVEDIGEIERYLWPTTDWFDYQLIPERISAIQQERERAIITANGNFFETAWAMRGFENLLIDFITNPELAHAIMSRVTDFVLAHFRNILEAGNGMIDLVFTADDIGGQDGLLLSLPTWEACIKPYHVQLNQLIHEYGARVIYHSDGAVMDAVDGLVDMGIDVLQALQFDARGMDPGRLKGEYGDWLCFEGGVSVQRTLPFGTPEDVRAETEHLIRTLGKAGGYILGPSHAIQAGTPPENVVAMLDTVERYYPF